MNITLVACVFKVKKYHVKL